MKPKKSSTALSPKEIDDLYAELEKNPPNIEEMAPAEIAKPIQTIACSIGGSDINIYSGLLPCLANLMRRSSVQLKEGHIQKIVLWNAGLGIRGSNKSGAFDISLIPLLKLEAEDHDEGERKFEHENVLKDEVTGEKSRKKKKLFYDKKQSQRVIQNGTLAGLEDVLIAKKNNSFIPNVIFTLDELSLLLTNLEKDEAFSNVFLSLHGGKPIRSNTRKGGLLEIDDPRVQVMGFSQPETIVKHKSKGEDTGGKLERFSFTYAPVAYKNLESEGNVDYDNLFPIDKFFKLIDQFHKTEGEKLYKFSEEGVKFLNSWLQEQNEKLKIAAVNPYSTGLLGKNISQIIRMSGVLKALMNAIEVVKKMKEVELDDDQEFNDEEKNELMSRNEIEVDIVKYCIAFSEHSNYVHSVLNMFATSKLNL